MKYIFFSTHITTRQSLAVYPMSVWCLEVELLWGPSGRFGDLALPSSATPPLSHGLGSESAMWRLSLLLVWFTLSWHSSLPPFLFLKFILIGSIENFFLEMMFVTTQVKRTIEQWTPNQAVLATGGIHSGKIFQLFQQLQASSFPVFASPQDILILLFFPLVWRVRYCRTAEQSMESLWGHLEW